MKRNLVMALCAIFYLITMQNIYAIRAYKEPIVVTQPNGTSLTIRLHGDEFHRYKTTDDGYLIKQNSKGYFVYLNTDNSSSDVIVNDVLKRTSAEKTLIKTLTKASAKQDLIQSNTKRNAIAPIKNSNKIQRAYPLLGSAKSLVILVNFSDKSFVTATPNTSFVNLLNESNYSANGGTGSARDYFMSASLGKFSPQFDVVGPYTLTKTLASYGGNDADDYDLNPTGLIVDACAAANAAGLDFTQYDTDNDDVLDNVFVYYAGFNEAEGGPANTIWPHRWVVYTSEESATDYTYSGTNASATFDGKRLYDYACTSELKGASGTSMCGIGTFCHEFGHVLGLPDYYHTEAEKSTLDDWSIMDYGGYLNQGRTPPTYSAYDRFFLGWQTPEQVSSATDLTLLPTYQGITTPTNTNQLSYLLSASNHNLSGTAPNPSEFFMLEYRKKTGWDSYLPSEGMLVWHIDYNQTAWNDNSPNNYTGTTQTASSHMRVYLQPLSGSTTTPGTAFTSGTFTPTTWSGTNINRAITAITKTDDNISFKLMGGTVGPTITITGTSTTFSAIVGTPTAAQSISISGVSLTNDVNISVPEVSNFEIKLSTETTWAKTATLVQNAGIVNATLNIRYNPTTAGNHSNTITFSSTGASTATLNVTGEATAPFDPNAAMISVGKVDNSLQFSATKTGTSRTKTLNIKTTDVLSELTLTLSGTNASLFSVSSTSLTKDAANANSGTNISIVYSPISVGAHTATLTIAGGGLIPAKVITLNAEGK